MLYERTSRRRQEILATAFELVQCWEHEIRGRVLLESPENKTETFPHAIVIDFEYELDTSRRRQVAKDLLFKNEHVPVSVSLVETLDRGPTHISSKDPELVSRFWEELERQAAVIREEMIDRLPNGLEFLLGQQQKLIKQWCVQVPVLGF